MSFPLQTHPPRSCCCLLCEGRNFRPSAPAACVAPSSPAEHWGDVPGCLCSVPAGESLNRSGSCVVRLSLGLTKLSPWYTLPASGSRQIQGFPKPEILSGSLFVRALHTPLSLCSGRPGGSFVLGSILRQRAPQRIWAPRDKRLPLICFKSAAA